MKVLKLDELKKKVETAVAALSGVKAMLSGSDILIMNATGTTQKRHRRTKAEIEAEKKAEAEKVKADKKVTVPKKLTLKPEKKAMVKKPTPKNPGKEKIKPTFKDKEATATPPA